MITFSEHDKIFHLQTKNTSYVIRIWQSMYLMHVYWGTKIRNGNIGWRVESPYRRKERITEAKVGTPQFTREYWPFEYPYYGTSDFRKPAFQIKGENGREISDLCYLTHRILAGKPELEGLPHVYCEPEDTVQTLEIDMIDSYTGLKVTLVYNVFEEYDVITRHTRFEAGGTAQILESAYSMSVDFKQAPEFMVQLSGTALRERHIVRRKLEPGTVSVESTRGISSHQQNPFLALVNEETTEESGEVYGINLVYSSSFSASVQLDMYRSARVQIGLNPENFSWELQPGEHFVTPEVVMIYSHEGLGGMSRRFHRIYRERLCRGIYRDKARPILLNTWEAAYFQIDYATVMRYAEVAKELGVELIVVDDGWFGERNNEFTSLGDWEVNTRKFPGGFSRLAEELKALGLGLGIWVEPEMISPNSKLYHEHPDWCIHAEGTMRTEWRNQLVLDLSRSEIVDYVIAKLTALLKSAEISYVKWDCNRRLTECGSVWLGKERQKEFWHRYMLGVYQILETLHNRFPYILFENCASGGGRFDPGMMYYFPQTWASDNTDGCARLKIQYGTSLCYPNIAVTSHISGVPNAQLGRTESLEFREHVCEGFNLGYELDFMSLSEEERVHTRAFIQRYKAQEELVRTGDFYRLKSPFEGEDTAWMLVSPDGARAAVWYFRPVAECEQAYYGLKLAGLNPSEEYLCLEDGCTYGGDILMNVGLNIPWNGKDYFSCMWRFERQRQ